MSLSSSCPSQTSMRTRSYMTCLTSERCACDMHVVLCRARDWVHKLTCLLCAAMIGALLSRDQRYRVLVLQ